MALDEQSVIVSFGRNRSGMYSGELDYSLRPHLMDKLDSEGVGEMVRLLEDVQKKFYSRLYKEGLPTPLHYRIGRIINFKAIKYALTNKHYKMWPIRIKWGQYAVTTPYITAHGWQIGWDRGERIFGWTLHLGRLKIMFGKDER